MLNIILICILTTALKNEITGPETQFPGVSTWRELEVNLPAGGGDDIRIMPGWPKKVSYTSTFAPCRGVALADLDNNGQLEVIMPSTAGQLHVWRADGTYYPGWPKTFSGSAQYTAAVADIDRDGQYEIAICTRGLTSGGAVYVFRSDGTVKTGWPFTGLVNGNFADSPTLADIDGDETLEVIVGERNYPIGHLHVLRHNGTPQPGTWPCSLDHVPALGAAVGDINLDGQPEIVYASYNSLYVFRPDGTLLPGWPVISPNGAKFSYQSPALADINDDDTLEIITAMHQGIQGPYVFRYDGTILTGWPYSFPRWTYCPPTVADLLRDDDQKIICGLSGIISSGAYVLYGFDDDGSVLTGFPIYQSGGDAAEGNITVADVDGDGDLEVIFTSNLMSSTDTLGYLYAVHYDGTPVSGWPLRPYGCTYLNGATVADVDGDDTMDIVTVSYDNGTTMAVTVWETTTPFTPASWEWPTYQFDMARTGRYRKPTVSIAEPAPNKPLPRMRLHPVVTRPGTRLYLTTVPDQHIPIVIYDRTGRPVSDIVISSSGVTLPTSLTAGVYFVKSPLLPITEKLLIVP